MSSLFDLKWAWIEGTNGMRSAVLDTLSDSDLAFNPGGQNLTLGALFRESGEIEYSYIQSLKTFKQDFSYRNPVPELDKSVAHLKAWFQTLDDDFKATASALSDDDARKIVDRGGGSQMPVDMQFDVYIQAALIFLGKTVVYLRAMNKPLIPSMQDYIG